MNAHVAKEVSRIAATGNKRQRMTNDPSFVLLIAAVAAGVVVVSSMVAGVDLFSIVDPGYFFED